MPTASTGSEGRSNVLAFGSPLFVPAPEFSPEWQVRAVHTSGSDRRPVSVTVVGGAASRYHEVLTTTAELTVQPLFVKVMNVLSASVPKDVSLPYCISVKQRHIELPIDSELASFEVLETEKAWTAEAVIFGRIVAAAGSGQLPDDLAFVSITDLHALPPHRLWLNTE